MINIADLKSSIYDSELFIEHSSQLKIINDEKQEQNSAVLRSVIFKSRGNFISLSNKLLKNNANNYRKIENDFSFRMDCDGIFLLHRDDRNYLIFTEVKSGFIHIRKKAFYQLITSYVKIKSFLATIDTYNKSDYKEVALIVSYPYESISNNSEYQLTRRLVVNDWSSLSSAYIASIKKKKQVKMNIKDFGIDKMHVTAHLIEKKLTVKHVCVPQSVETHTINLDDII